MNIAYIANSRFPSEKAQSDHVMSMCSAFAEQGHKIVLLVPDRRPVVAEDPFAYYGKIKSFHFERVPCLDALRWSWLGPIGLWIQTITFVWNLKKIVARLQPNVVYSRELYTFLFQDLPGLRVWEAHALPKSWWARALIRRIDKVVTLTRASSGFLEAMGIGGERILVEPDAVNPALFQNPPSRQDVRRALGIEPDDFVCLYTGKFTTMGMPKGLDEAITAIRELRNEGRCVRLFAVGGTSEELVRYASQTEEGMTFIGHQPQSELNRFYGAADLLLMPFPFTEHYAYFMSPLKLFEYLMSGVPMVVTDLPSVRDIVSEREAFFASPGDIFSLSQQIAIAMDHPQDAQDRAQAARGIADRYTWSKRAERIASWLSHR